MSLSGNVVSVLNVTGNIAGGNISTVGIANLGNIGISGDTITGTNGIVKVNSALGDIDFAVSGLTANIFYIDAGVNTASFGSNTQTTNALVAFNATNSILIPVGNTAQRPGTGVAGMVRYNTTTTQVEAYNGTNWLALGSAFTVITSETFNGDGSTTSFTLGSANFSTDSVIVTLNGVVQQPLVAYAVSGTALVFTEAPADGDVIVVRELQTTATVASLASGDSTLGFATSNGNATFTIAGTSNVMVVTQGGVDITGNLTVSGNATLSGNILGDRIQNGTTTIDIQSASGNANITVAATSNVAVFTTGGLNLTGALSATANIIGGNLNASGLSLSGNVVSAINTTANITGSYFVGNGSLLTGVTATGIGTLASLSVTGNIDTGNLRTAGLVSATGNVTGGNVLTGGLVSATGNISGGNINAAGLSLSGNVISAINTTENITTTGNISVGNLIMSGSGGALSGTGNITAGNLLTGGLISATGAITGAAITGSTLSSTGNVNTVGIVGTGNISTTGNISGGNVSATGIAGTLSTAAQTNITSVGTLTALAVTGNITSGNLSGTSIVGTLTTAAQTNITSVGTLTALAVTGNITSGNVQGTLHSGTTVSVTGNVTGGNVNAGNITIAADLISSLGTTLTIDPATTGNAGLVIINGNLQVNGTTTTINSNVVSTNDLTVNYANNAVNSAAANGGGIEIGPIGSPFITWLYNNSANVFTSSAGISAVGGVTGGIITGSTLSSTGNVNTVGIVGTGNISTTGNISGGNVSATGIAGTLSTAAQTNITSVGTLTALAVTGNITSGNLSGTSIVGTLTTAAQTNITSVGTLTALAVTGNITSGNVQGTLHSGTTVSVTGNVTGGNVNAGNITIAADLISSLGTTLTIDPATTGNAGLVIINGNLQVNGTTTTINSNVVSTNDLTVNYANNAVNSAAANGGGIEIGPIGSPFITWLYNNSANVFTSSAGISAVGGVTGGIITGSTLSSTGNVNTVGIVGTGNISTTGNVSGGNVSATGIAGTLSTAAQTNITSVGTLTSLAVTGNITSGNVQGTLHSGTTVSVTGVITGASVVGGVMTGSSISVSGAVTGASLTVGTGNITGGNIVNGNGNGIGNIGSSTVYFNTVFAKATSAQYADLAELYTADAEYEPGTVVEFGGAAEVTLSTKVGSTRVAGVVSTNPSYIMNASLQAEHVATVALQGRVPCKVIGPVSKGDMMVAAGGGYAKVDNNAKAGSIIGKALEVLHNPHGVIEVVVGRN